jgi:hypothetical protein
MIFFLVRARINAACKPAGPPPNIAMSIICSSGPFFPSFVNLFRRFSSRDENINYLADSGSITILWSL